MKKSINMVFENCRVDGDDLWEDVQKGEPLCHSIKGIFEKLEGEEGLTITIKKTAKIGEIRAKNS